MSLIIAERSSDSEVEQLRVADHRVERRAQLVTHHREELRLRMIRRLRLGARDAFTIELRRTFFGALAMRHVAQSNGAARLSLPIRVDDTKLGRNGRPAGTHDVDLRGLAGDG